VIRVSTRIRDAEILRLYMDGVHVKRIAQILHLSSKWVAYRAILRGRRHTHCEDCPNNPYRSENANLRQTKS
jgi:transposase-like protein